MLSTARAAVHRENPGVAVVLGVRPAEIRRQVSRVDHAEAIVAPVEQHHDVVGSRRGEPLPSGGSAPGDSLGHGDAGKRAHALDRAQEPRGRYELIGRQVEERAALAGLVHPSLIGGGRIDPCQVGPNPPPLGFPIGGIGGHVRPHRGHPADRASGDEGLGAPRHRLERHGRRRRQLEPPRFRQLHDLGRLLERSRNGLFNAQMPAGFEHLLGMLVVLAVLG